MSKESLLTCPKKKTALDHFLINYESLPTRLNLSDKGRISVEEVSLRFLLRVLLNTFEV